MTHFDLPPVFNFDDPRVKLMLDRVSAKNIRVTGIHVAQSKTLQFIAYWYAGTYHGSYDFMRKMHVIINRGGGISHNQAAGVINCLVFDAKRRKPAKVEDLPADLPAVATPRMAGLPNQQVETCAWCGATLRISEGVYNADGCVCKSRAVCRSLQRAQMIAKPIACDPENSTSSTLYVRDQAELNADYPLDPIGARRFNDTVTPAIANGTYTVVLNESGDYRTLKIEDAPEKFNKPGAQIASYLSGADNERDFTGFAFLFGTTIRLWKSRGPIGAGEQPEPSRRLTVDALKILVSAPEDRQRDYGMAYALESGRCYRCGRTLTVPASIHRGLGPDCAKKG